LGPEDANRAIELAHDFGIEDVLDRSARTLSGGERQRLALARALARPEQVVLLDEPLAALDARDRGSVAATIKRELRGRTAIVVTHDREEAAMLGERMAVLVDGRILQIGALEEVFSLPTDDRVAAAVGIANVLRGEVIQTEGALSAIRSGPVEVWGVGDVAPGTKATAMFGAEAVTVFAGSEPASGSARNTFSGTVMEVRSAGRLVELVVDCGTSIAALVTPGSLEALGVAAKTDVVLTLKATAVRVVAT
jgi:molybdopterin-binding protein